MDDTNRIIESAVEPAALDWLDGLGYEVLPGLTATPGETSAERAAYKQVFLFDRLRTKLEDLNPKIPLEGVQEASWEMLLPKLLSGGLQVPPTELPKVTETD